MPTSKSQRFYFSILMAFFMVYGMEVYNHILLGIKGIPILTIHLFDLLLLMSIAILLQSFIAGPTARWIAFKFVNPKSDNKLKVILSLQIVTVFIMCPLMSGVATLLYNSNLNMPFLFKWTSALLLNFPFALAWQLLIAGPSVRTVVGFFYPS